MGWVGESELAIMAGYQDQVSTTRVSGWVNRLTGEVMRQEADG